MSERTKIPERCDVVVIGGGPAGSGTAGYIAKAGYDVVLLDKVKHPRNQVGESLVPHMWRLTDNLGVSQKILDAGFLTKAGGITVWDGKISALRFSDFGYKDRLGMHVERDQFDELLLRHAESLGAKVFEEVIARGVDFSKPGAPVVTYDDRRFKNGGGEHPGTIQARYVVDASGYGALLAKQFDSRHFFRAERKFLSLWGYFEGSRYFAFDGAAHSIDRVREIKPVTFVSKYEDGWVWHIILRKTTSVGFAMDNERTRGMNRKEQEEYFLSTVKRIPYLSDLLRDATYVPDSLTFRPDYSYYSDKIVGDDYFCVGDAAAFVDPIFSQGVLGCLFHASTASWAIVNALQNPVRKSFYQEMFQQRVLQYYSASRLVGVGDFGGAGIDPVLATKLLKSWPRNEVELLFSAAHSTGRGHNMVRALEEMGMDSAWLHPKLHRFSELRP